MNRNNLGQPGSLPPPPPPRRPVCTPPGRPRIPQVPVCPPTPLRGFVTPFGGPASGISPAGPSAPAAAPAVVPAPTPVPPVPTCVTATDFTECFTGCDGAGNCGWTIVTPAGTVVFDGVKVNEGSSGLNAQGEVRKPLSAFPAGDFTAQFTLQEVAAPPTANITYALGMFDALGNSFISIALFGDGSLFIGDMTNIYIGTWTPVSGTIHTVHITRTATGTLTLYIDGIVIPLVFLAPGPVVGMAGVADLSIANNDLSGQGSYDNVFLADGILPPSTEFCCT